MRNGLGCGIIPKLPLAVWGLASEFFLPIAVHNGWQHLPIKESGKVLYLYAVLLFIIAYDLDLKKMKNLYNVAFSSF